KRGGGFGVGSSFHGRARLLDLGSGRARGLLELPASEFSRIAAFDFSPDGWSLTAPRGGEILRWDARGRASNNLALEAPAGEGGTRVLAYTLDDRQGAVMDERRVRLHDAQTGKLQQVLDTEGGLCTRLVFSGDGRRVAAGRRDGTVRVWERDSGALSFS